MTFEQALCCEKFISWCGLNMGPMIMGADLSAGDVAEECIQKIFPENPFNVAPIEKYIQTCLDD